jgi:CTP synthase
MDKLNLQARKLPDWKEWKMLVRQVEKKKPTVKIALVGKYVELHDAYMSVREAINHAALHLGVEPEIAWIPSAELERGKNIQELEEAHAILVPGGFGSRGIEGKIQAARLARTHNIPYLGLCLGMQLMVTEFGRNILNDESANSTEFDRSTTNPVIDLMPDQQNVSDMGGTMRLDHRSLRRRPDLRFYHQ